MCLVWSSAIYTAAAANGITEGKALVAFGDWLSFHLFLRFSNDRSLSGKSSTLHSRDINKSKKNWFKLTPMYLPHTLSFRLHAGCQKWEGTFVRWCYDQSMFFPALRRQPYPLFRKTHFSIPAAWFCNETDETLWHIFLPCIAVKTGKLHFKLLPDAWPGRTHPSRVGNCWR